MKYYGRSYNSGEKTMGIIMLIAVLVVGIIIGPLITFWLGYFGGWLAKIIIGAKLCEALTYLGLTVTPEMLPWIGGALAWIGGFFKSVNTNSRD